MVTALWLCYDIMLFVAGLRFVERKLTIGEKRVVAFLVVIGLAVAAYGSYSEHRDAKVITSLKQQISDLKKDSETHFTHVDAYFAVLRKALHLPPDEPITNVLAIAVKALCAKASDTAVTKDVGTAKIATPKPRSSPTLRRTP
jgi:hypothetical protein